VQKCKSHHPSFWKEKRKEKKSIYKNVQRKSKDDDCKFACAGTMNREKKEKEKKGSKEVSMVVVECDVRKGRSVAKLAQRSREERGVE